MSKRILIFSLVYFPRFVGGAEIAIKEITDRISSEDAVFDMIVIDSDAPKHEQIGNVHVYRVIRRKNFGMISKYLYIFAAFIKAVKLHKKNKYDRTWAMMANYAGFAGLFFKIRYPKVPFILSLQEGDSFEHIKKRLNIFVPLYRKIFKKADTIQVISKHLKDFGKDMGFDGNPIVISNGVNNESFAYRNEVKINEIKNAINKKPGDVFLVTSSRLVYKNAIGDLISALGYLPTYYKLLILGVGELEDQLKAQVEAQGLKDRVVFGGYVGHDILPQYLHASDIFIRPSYSEGLGNSFIEAMAARIPVIATPVGGIVDFLIPQVTGLFCEVGNPRSIADTVMKLSDKDLRENIVHNAADMVKRDYEWDSISKQMKGLFIDPGSAR
jgi:teichuronic acid biosynthesis glycosyltransferase TuaC